MAKESLAEVRHGRPPLCDMLSTSTLSIFCDGVILSAVGLLLFAGRPERNDQN